MNSNSGYSLIQKNVSRETFSLMEQYVALLLKWNKSINLIGASTENEIWDRHILDAWQIVQYLPSIKTKPRLLDMGSGAGLPGMILAMLGYELVMVESDERKCVFLKETIRVLGLHAQVNNCRMEVLDMGKFDIITARALAPLSQLLTYAFPHMGINGQCIFPKGQTYSMEIVDARKQWQFSDMVHPSQCHPKSVILQLSNISSV